MSRRLALVTLLLLIATAASALDTSTRAVGPLRTWSSADLERFDAEWLHVKFVEGADVLAEALCFSDPAGHDLTGVNAALAATGVTEIRRTFSGERAILREKKARGEAAVGGVGPDLSLWYNLRVPGGKAAVANLVNALNASPAVEIAHPTAQVEVAPLNAQSVIPAVLRADPQTPDFTSQQYYLFDTPVGLDAPAAWAQTGGRGADMKFIDVELGWILDHEDFNPANQFYIGGGPMDPFYFDHGTAVLGEVIGWDNGFGVTGFAGDALYGVVAVTVDEWPVVPHYFQEAIDNLDAGDVWLIELQMYPPECTATPMEWLQVNYDVIWTGCWAEGVVCVEAGANGGQDLDDPSWGGVFDRDVRDSGAIMVAAGTPYGRVAESYTNYGSRMDNHAWGSQIVSTGVGDLYDGGSPQTQYTATFGGTSGASPMVTGSALCLQGIVKALYGAFLSPEALRDLLSSTGIPHLDPVKEIGPRPDLGAAVEAVVDLTAAPGGFALTARLRAAPNPFMAETLLSFASGGAAARVEIFDVSGRRVRALTSATGTVVWDGRDDHGRELGAGVYLTRAQAGGEIATGRVVKLR